MQYLRAEFHRMAGAHPRQRLTEIVRPRRLELRLGCGASYPPSQPARQIEDGKSSADGFVSWQASKAYKLIGAAGTCIHRRLIVVPSCPAEARLGNCFR